ncbi:MAG: hypothetical protein JKY42_11280, partial [Flavobacteriales bacterium]|nr:hypothetical protein [Flavobacteriales bacterium]
ASTVAVKKEKISLLKVLESSTNVDGLNSFSIKLETFDFSIIPDLNKGIKFYFDSNPYLKENLTVKREYLTNLISKLELEIKEQDELQVMLINIINDKNENTILNPTSSNSMENIVLLHKQKEAHLKDLKLLDNVEIIQEAYLTQKSQLSALTSIASFGFIFLILGIISALLIEVHKIANAST